MVRIKRGAVAKRRRRKVLKRNKGFQAPYRSLFRVANQRYVRTKIFSYRDRKRRKRLFRSLWNHRFNSAVRLYGLSLSQSIHLCRKLRIKLNRKIISQLAIYDPEAFFSSLRSNFIL
nr:ribosomal protein L20 [Ostreobium quekettii]